MSSSCCVQCNPLAILGTLPDDITTLCNLTTLDDNYKTKVADAADKLITDLNTLLTQVPSLSCCNPCISISLTELINQLIALLTFIISKSEDNLISLPVQDIQPLVNIACGLLRFLLGYIQNIVCNPQTVSSNSCAKSSCNPCKNFSRSFSFSTSSNPGQQQQQQQFSFPPFPKFGF